MSSESPAPTKQSPLGDPRLRKQLEEFVRRRVPSADVDDVVQTVLCDALAARERPEAAEELKRWLLGIARHKVVDHHRRAHREPPTELPDLEAAPPPVEERGLVTWAERVAGGSRDGEATLRWMAREGEGDKLETIAAEERVPAARVRQRVSRMRRWMKERWLAELAAVAALAVIAFFAWRWVSKPEDVPPEARPEKQAPSGAPDSRDQQLEERLGKARDLRAEAMRRCGESAYQACLDGLDAAKALDPAGDSAPEVQGARDEAVRGLAPPPQPIPSDVPHTKAAPPPPPTTPAPFAKPSDDDMKKADMSKALEGKRKPAPGKPKATGYTGKGGTKMSSDGAGSSDLGLETPGGEKGVPVKK